MVTVKTTPEFNKKYKMLNPAQKLAVDSIEGPVMVIAGPGTGKTQILTLRIANILRLTDTPPDAILALTFTENAAANMKERLLKMIGPEAYKVRIHTFHGFANSLIQEDPENFERLVLSSAMTDIEKILLLARIVEDGEYKELKPFYDNHMHLSSIMGAISELKRDAITPGQLKAFSENEIKKLLEDKNSYNNKTGKLKVEPKKTEKKLVRGLELADIYAHYEELLKEEKMYDFEDMILEVVKVMQNNEDFKMQAQENFLYVLADEHQDANDAQNALLELLTDFHENPNLFIVGDEKQAIYRFQGASLENFLYFKDKFKNAKIIELKDAYRSGQEILDASYSLMQASGEEIKRQKLKSRANIEKATVELDVYSNDELESLMVAKKVKSLINNGVLPEEIALIYRTNADAEIFAHALAKEGVPFQVTTGTDALKDNEIRKFLTLLDTVSNFGNDEKLAHALHLDFLDLDELDIYKTLKHYRRSKKTLHEILLSEKELKSIKLSNYKKMLNFGRFLARFSKLAKNEPLPDFMNEILNNSGFLTFILNKVNSLELLDKLHALFKDANVMSANKFEYKLKDFLTHLEILQKHNLAISKDSAQKRNTVKLLTAHKSKGLEFEYVFILKAYDKKWGNRASRNKFILPTKSAKFSEGNADERRLFFVALTRAKQAVYISYGKYSEAEKERMPSVFITEIGEEYIKPNDTRKDETEISKTELLKSPPENTKSIADLDYLRELFIEQGLSVTALNNFLDCPWKFFYSNLIRIPKMQDKYLLLGNVLHYVLFVLFEGFKAGKQKTQEQLFEKMEEYLKKRAVGDTRAKEILALAKEYLNAWMSYYNPIYKTKTLNEYPIDVIYQTGIEEIPQLRLTGKLDKLEFKKEGSKDVVVYDYKTGKPKTRNQMLGKNKDGNKDYFRQLVFYKLLLELEGKYNMTSGVIDFIQPKDNGKMVKEEFEITTKDLDELKEEINDVVSDIYNFNFWNKRCQEHEKGKCEYCALRDSMR